VTPRTVDIFFYGLFMDMGLLQQRGLHPSHPQAASLDGYAMVIGDRATLMPSTEARVYGIVTGLTFVDIDMLYAEPSVREYRPEAVLVTREDGRQVPALCYTLPHVADAPRNTTYAVQLLALAKTLGFPAVYLDTLQRFAR
jgi:Gamma-glutamyl cyclotransferase, AIG2-like